jgi:hypothetical protein
MASLATCLTIIAVLRIRDPVPFLPLDPGSRMGKESRSGSLYSLIRIRDGKKSDPGKTSRIRNTEKEQMISDLA